MRGKFNHSGIGAIHPYSLIEMLVVIGIIAILVGLGAGGYSVGRRWASQSRTEALLAKLKLALESYKNDKGYYPLPHTPSGTIQPKDIPCFRLDTNNIDYIPTVKPTDPEYMPRNNMSNFIDYSKIKIDQALKFEYNNWYYYYVKDAWNAPVLETQRATLIDGNTHEFGEIKYRCPGLINKTSFDLYSAGPDRKFAADPTTNIEDDIYAK